MSLSQFDLVVVGRSIVGLAHALTGARAGLRVAVIDRETRSIGASIRDFRFVTVTGQQAGISWHCACHPIMAEMHPSRVEAFAQLQVSKREPQ